MNANDYFRGLAYNFMTPNVMERKFTPEGKAYELSTGRSIAPGCTIYGVTVCETPRTINHDLSTSFHDEGEAREYIASI